MGKHADCSFTGFVPGYLEGLVVYYCKTSVCCHKLKIITPFLLFPSCFGVVNYSWLGNGGVWFLCLLVVTIWSYNEFI